MSRWFRFYDGALDDPKVQRLSPVLFKAWVNLMCLASRNDGNIHAADIAFALRVTEKTAGEIVADLGAAGLIDEFEGRFTPHNWDKRQFKSDVSNERVKQFRERNRNVTPAVTVTPPETEQNRTETDKEDRPKRVRTLCSDDFENFWKAYPRTPNMSKSEAWKAWQRLSDEDRVAATAAVPKYISFLRSKTDHPTVHACRFLSQRRFDGFNEPVAANDQPAAEIFVPLDNPKWGHLAGKWREANKQITGPPPKDYPSGTGWYFPSEWVA